MNHSRLFIMAALAGAMVMLLPATLNSQPVRAKRMDAGTAATIQIPAPPEALTSLSRDPKFLAAVKKRDFAAVRKMVEGAGGATNWEGNISCRNPTWGPVFYPDPPYSVLGNNVPNTPPGTWLMGWICNGGGIGKIPDHLDDNQN